MDIPEHLTGLVATFGPGSRLAVREVILLE